MSGVIRGMGARRWRRELGVVAATFALVLLGSAGLGAAATATTLLPPPSTPGSWANLTHAGGPSARGEPAMAYDAKDHYVVLFGGCPVLAFPCTQPANDTWTFVNSTWTNVSRTVGVAPGHRDYSAMAYDAKGRFVLMFGGWGGTSVLGDTWKFAGGKWTDITPKKLNATNSPPARDVAGMAYDASTGAVVLFGGIGSAGTYLGDTWEFLGGHWKSLAPATSPSGREIVGAISTDPRVGGVLVFGGYGYLAGTSGTVGYLNDTWKFSGGTWTNVTTASDPKPRAGAVMDYDAAHGIVLMFGGKYFGTLTNGSQIYYADTWAYSPTGWHNLTRATGPLGRSAAAIAYDGLNKYSVLFGGHLSGPTLALFNDTWRAT